MRCIDEWLMRSYCCPSCMERVDVGMSNTLTSSSPSPTHTGLRRRCRRHERGSTSSLASLVSLGAARPHPRGVEGRGTKRREGAQYVPVSQHLSGQAASPVGLPPPRQAMYPSGQPAAARVQMPCPTGQRRAMSRQVPVASGGVGRNMNYFTDLSISGQSSGHTSSAQSSGHASIGQVEGASGGYDHDVQLLNDPELQRLSQDDLAYSMDQITYCDFQSASSSNSRDQPSPQGPVGVTTSPRFSPPVFEYHFEYPPSQLPATPQQ